MIGKDSLLRCDFKNDAGLNDGKYIPPNEFLNNHYGDELQNDLGDMLISVGTFRSFITFGLGNFTYAIFADYDQKVVDFNKLLLELMIALDETKMSSKDQRLQFISLLTKGFMLNSDELDLYKKNDNEAINFRNLLNAATGNKQDIFDAKILAIMQEINSFFASIKYPDFNFKKIKEKMRLFYEASSVSEDILQKVFGNLWSEQQYSIFIERDRKYRFFWENDEQWQKIIDAANANRIAVIIRDISHEEFYQDVRQCLNDLNATIGVIDYSNILPSNNFLKIKQKKSIVEEINKLPKTLSSTMFFTDLSDDKKDQVEFIAGQKVAGNYWRYFLVKLADLATSIFTK